MIELDCFNLTNFDRQAPQTCLTDALNKFDVGGKITTSELKLLIKFFQALEGLCAARGKTFELQRRHADAELRVLEGFKASRERKF